MRWKFILKSPHPLPASFSGQAKAKTYLKTHIFALSSSSEVEFENHHLNPYNHKMLYKLKEFFGPIQELVSQSKPPP
jgi:hypothetical protein